MFEKAVKNKWQDKIPDTEVLKKAGMQSMHTVLKLTQLRWTGHVIRMPYERFPKKVFYGELQEGKRSQGGQKKTLRRHSQSFSEGFRHTNGVLGTDCTRANQCGEVSSTKQQLSVKERESVKLKESAEITKPRPMG